MRKISQVALCLIAIVAVQASQSNSAMESLLSSYKGISPYLAINMIETSMELSPENKVFGMLITMEKNLESTISSISQKSTKEFKECMKKAHDHNCHKLADLHKEALQRHGKVKENADKINGLIAKIEKLEKKAGKAFITEKVLVAKLTPLIEQLTEDSIIIGRIVTLVRSEFSHHAFVQLSSQVRDESSKEVLNLVQIMMKDPQDVVNMRNKMSFEHLKAGENVLVMLMDVQKTLDTERHKLTQSILNARKNTKEVRKGTSKATKGHMKSIKGMQGDNVEHGKHIAETSRKISDCKKNGVSPAKCHINAEDRAHYVGSLEDELKLVKEVLSELHKLSKENQARMGEEHKPAAKHAHAKVAHKVAAHKEAAHKSVHKKLDEHKESVAEKIARKVKEAAGNLKDKIGHKAAEKVKHAKKAVKEAEGGQKKAAEADEKAASAHKVLAKAESAAHHPKEAHKEEKAAKSAAHHAKASSSKASSDKHAAATKIFASLEQREVEEPTEIVEEIVEEPEPIKEVSKKVEKSKTVKKDSKKPALQKMDSKKPALQKKLLKSRSHAKNDSMDFSDQM